jgi:hypothetical protein
MIKGLIGLSRPIHDEIMRLDEKDCARLRSLLKCDRGVRSHHREVDMQMAAACVGEGVRACL